MNELSGVSRDVLHLIVDTLLICGNSTINTKHPVIELSHTCSRFRKFIQHFVPNVVFMQLIIGKTWSAIKSDIKFAHNFLEKERAKAKKPTNCKSLELLTQCDRCGCWLKKTKLAYVKQV